MRAKRPAQHLSVVAEHGGKSAFAGLKVHLLPSSIVLNLFLLDLAHREVLGLGVGKVQTRTEAAGSIAMCSVSSIDARSLAESRSHMAAFSVWSGCEG